MLDCICHRSPRLGVQDFVRIPDLKSNSYCTVAADFERATDYDYIKDIIHTSIQRINSLKQENANATVATAVASSGTKSKHTKQKDRSSNEGKNLRGVEAFVGK